MAIGVVEAIYKLNLLFINKHREKAKSTGKTQGILSDGSVVTLCYQKVQTLNNLIF